LICGTAAGTFAGLTDSGGVEDLQPPASSKVAASRSAGDAKFLVTTDEADTGMDSIL
jgi:hypothetical protein